MRKEDRPVFELIRQVAQNHVPQGGKVFLYGSRARGEAHSGSDWDLLIILNKSAIEQSDYDNVSYPFFESGLRVGQLFSPLLYTENEWDNRKSTLFYYNIQTDGIRIL